MVPSGTILLSHYLTNAITMLIAIVSFDVATISLAIAFIIIAISLAFIVFTSLIKYNYLYHTVIIKLSVFLQNLIIFCKIRRKGSEKLFLQIKILLY